MVNSRIPNSVSSALTALKQGDFSGYLVGGCVRDILMDRVPKDWDITTNARPEQILGLFSGSKYENDFGTVLVPTKDELKCLEITTYRSEQGYADRRHPDSIKFETELDKDLERRDFTINALAYDDEKIVDLFGGQKDIGKQIIRTVGEPADRFKEDALRMLRAIRFACVLDFKIEDKTWRGILKLAGSIKFVSAERIRDELVKILASTKPYLGITMLHEAKLLRYILPELEDGLGFKQNHHHIYTVFEHNMYCLEHCPSIEWQVRLAALLHDVGKPKSFKIISGQPTFYNHEYIGAKIVERIVKRLKFSNEDGERIVNLVRNHMFYYNVGEVTAASVRRLLAKVGKENLRDLIAIRVADRLGSGNLKAKPYRLRHLEYMFERVQNDPISVKHLKLNGEDVMKILKITPGPIIGAILEVLLGEVLENPELNDKKLLKQRILELADYNLDELRVKAKELIVEHQIADDKALKKTFGV